MPKLYNFYFFCQFFPKLFYGKINFSRINPKNLSVFPEKIHPKWAWQERQIPICQSYLPNHENSLDREDAGAHPRAWLKHPISNTWPKGLAKVWENPWLTSISNLGAVTELWQDLHRITGSSCSKGLISSLGRVFRETSLHSLARSIIGKSRPICPIFPGQ